MLPLGFQYGTAGIIFRGDEIDSFFLPFSFQGYSATYFGVGLFE
jgi:hypothetical protein